MAQTCRYCQCTDMRACAGGCSWVAPSVCSACMERQCDEILEAVLPWANTHGLGRHTATIGDRPCTIEIEPKAVAIRDHLGVYIFTADEDGAWRAPHYEPEDLLAIFKTKHARAA